MSVPRRLLAFVLISVLMTAACVPTLPTTEVPPTPTPVPAPAATPTSPPAKMAPAFEQGLTTESLAVLSAQPADKAADVAVARGATRVVVQFNHPVVPLTGVEGQRALPQPLTLQPAVQGEGEWLNTSTYAFTPAQDLAVATVYTVTLSPMRDMLGMELSGYSWSFRTASPSVIKSYPDANSQYVATSQPISLTFNTQMDRSSTESRFSLTSGGNPVPGRLEWQGAVLRFVPAQPLSYDTNYTLRVTAGAQDVNRVASTPKDFVLTFRTVKQPAVLATSPADGARDARQQRNGFQITFASPMDPEGVKVTIVPTITNQRVNWRYDSNNTVALVYGGWLPSQSYTVTIGGQSRTREGDTLGKDVMVRFASAPADPQLYFTAPDGGNMGMYEADQPIVVYAGITNIDRIDYRLYRVPREDVLKLMSREQYQFWRSYQGADANLLRQWSQTVEAPLNVSRLVSTTVTVSGGATLAPGVYYLQGNAAGVSTPARHLLLVTKLNLALKNTDEEALVWVTELATGKPVADVAITLYDPSMQPLATLKSDRDGLLRATFAAPIQSWGNIYATQEVDGQILAAAGSDWQSGISPWEFGLNANRGGQDYYGNLYTDRAVYRPGQTVYFKGVLRKDNDAEYTLPDLQNVIVQVRDNAYRLVYTQTVALNEFGTFNGEVQLSEAASIGDYSMSLDIKGRFYANTSFQVAEYRAPEFQVTVTADKNEYINGEAIRVESASSYFFGGPVSDAAVTWRLMSYDYSFHPDTVTGWWDFADWDYTEPSSTGGKVIRDGKGQTDAQGRFRFELPADVSEFPQSQSFVLETEVTDVNNQAVASRATVPVHKGRYYIGLRPQRYVGTVGKEQAVDVITVDTRGLTVTNQTLAVSIYQRQWYSVREKQEDGSFRWRSSYTDTLVAESGVTTDGSGAAVARFTPSKGGTYRVVAQGADAVGNKIRSATYLWVADTGFVNWRMEDNDRIGLVADKKQYAPGDVAEILVPAPFGQAEALLTIERGSIREVRRLFLQGNSERLQIPIKPDYAPNVFVSIMLVKGRGPDSPQPQFKLGYVNLPVSAAEKQLTVKLTADRARYVPGDQATFTVEAADATGRPVKAEFSLALVDKAIQSLADDRSVPTMQAFWGQRALAVTTAASLERSMERVNQVLKAEGGKGGGGALLEKPVRRDFRDTAYWNPAVVTDQTGRARVTVTLPDNLTTWNMAAKGVTQSTLVGEARADILSTKDVLVRPVLPRFFVVGDKARLEAVINNNTTADVALDVRLDAAGLVLAGSAQQPLTVKANDKAKVGWDVTVSPVEVVSLTVSASGGGYRDAVELSLPVRRPTALETVDTAGQVDTKIVEKIEVPAAADRMAGDLLVSLSPSLAAASRDSLRYLAAFDYDCSEQAVSKFFPNAATYLALKKLGIVREDLRKDLEANILKAVPRLYGLQNRDGGWGWWSGEQSSPMLTAYALLALFTARQAGFSVDTDVMTRAEQYLTGYLNKAPSATASYTYNERAFVVFVLSEMGRAAMVSRATTLYDQRANLDLYAKALLLMALTKGGQPQAQTLVTELTSSAITSATGTHWEEKQPDTWGMNTNTRTTAMVIMALTRADPKNALLPNAVRWLMVARKEGHWETTQVTAWSVLALTDFMAATGELVGNYTYDVAVNGQALASGSVDKGSVDQSREVRVAIRDLVQNAAVGQAAANEVTISRGPGDGRLYYSAYLNYYLPADKIGAQNRGILVGRQYFAVDNQTLKPTDRQIESAQIGDYVQVRLTLVAPTDLHYLVLEDGLPAGFEAVDNSLKTSTAAAAAPLLKSGVVVAPVGTAPSDETAVIDRYGWPYWHYWSHTEIRDDRVAVFATYLGRGVYEYSYIIRAALAGQFRALPARAWEMYFPEVFGRSGSTLFTVK